MELNRGTFVVDISKSPHAKLKPVAIQNACVADSFQVLI